MFQDPLYIVAVLMALVALSEWLVRTTPLRHLGTALLVIVLTAVVANVGIIPTGTGGVPVYDGIFGYLAPLGIFWLLLGVDLRRILAAGSLMLGLFLLGALGTSLGTIAGMLVVDGSASIGPKFAALAGMFTGTYTGGSVNFNAIAVAEGVMEDGLLFAGATAVDSIVTTIWMVVTIVLPRFLPKGRRGLGEGDGGSVAATGDIDDTESVHPTDLAIVIGIGAVSIWISRVAAGWLSEAIGRDVNYVLVLTTLALVLAQTPLARRLRGTRLLGMFAIYVFLAVIGAFCDVRELIQLGELGVTIFLFACVVVAVHGTLIFGGATALRISPAMAAVASQANVGGGTTAIALARSLGRPDLVLPGILVGSLGTGIGTYLGFSVVSWLTPG